MRKKLCVLISVSMMALTLAACGSKDTSGTPSGGDAGTGVTVTVEPTATKAPTEAPEPKATNTPTPTNTSEPTKAPEEFPEVSLADTEIPGLYWCEEYQGYDFGWTGTFMYIRSDGVVYTWFQSENDWGDATVYKVSKVTTCNPEADEYSECAKYFIYIGNEKYIYSTNYDTMPFVGKDYDIAKGALSFKFESMPYEYYLPGNVVFEAGNPSTEIPTAAPTKAPSVQNAKYEIATDLEYNYWDELTCVIWSSGNCWLSEMTIPEEIEGRRVTMIAGYAFSGREQLKKLEIPGSVTYIAEYAFSNCTGLTNVELRDGVETIDHHAFLHCTSLTSITIPASVTYISDTAFDECINLTNIITTPGSYAEEWFATHTIKAPEPTATPTPTPTPVPTLAPEDRAYDELDFNPCTRGHKTAKECFDAWCECPTCGDRFASIVYETGRKYWNHSCEVAPKLFPSLKAVFTASKVATVEIEANENKEETATITYEDGTVEIHKIFKGDDGQYAVKYSITYANGDTDSGIYSRDKMAKKEVEIGVAPFVDEEGNLLAELCPNGHNSPEICFEENCKCAVCKLGITGYDAFAGKPFWYHECLGPVEEAKESDIPGIYWRESYDGYDFGWIGMFMVINSDGTVYTWTETESGTFDAEVSKITKITPFDPADSEYVYEADFTLHLGEEMLFYYARPHETPVVGYETDFEFGACCLKIDSIPEGYYVPSNVVFE